MSSDDGVSERGMASRVGLSVTSRTNLSGIVFGLIFLSSWTSSMLMGGLETGRVAMHVEFGGTGSVLRFNLLPLTFIMYD